MDKPKKCFVPMCPNTSQNAPKKLFIHINDAVKRTWCRKFNIDFHPKRHDYCCEDHLNLEEDLENYQYWKLMKGRPILKRSATLRYRKPCGPSTSENLSSAMSDIPKTSKHHEFSELQKLLLMEGSLPKKQLKSSSSTSTTPKYLFKEDKATQCKVKTEDKGVCFIGRKNIKLSQNSQSVPMIFSSTSITSTSPSLFGFTTDTETSSTIVPKEKNLRSYFLNIVYESPQEFLGLPKQFLWVLKHVCKKNKNQIKELDLIVTLFKIRQNDSMIRISRQFEVARSALPKIFCNGIEALANYFQYLIYLPSPIEIKKNLPMVFKIRFSNVQMILDCFEIEIEKPSDPLRQAQTWSQYKNCNTVKYLIGCTPNGHVAFISNGFGGRISDKAILEKSGLIKILPFNAVVMADRGFKEVETHLMSKGVKLLRPPSVYSGFKPTKEDVIQTKIIASLRVHVERVIRRVREFRLLKPHSTIKYNHVSYMNQLVIIVCGLLNFQCQIIKCD